MNPSAITRATWQERSIDPSGDWRTHTGWRTECVYCADVYLNRSYAVAYRYATSHRHYCPDAPTLTEDSTA